MRRFHFRLQRLLELRAYRERQWEARLAEITGTCMKLSRRIEQTRVDARAGFSLDYRQGARLDLELLSARERYLARLDHERRALQQELTQRLQDREEVRAGYLEASRERKVLDKLRERREAEYYSEQRMEEHRVLDDINNGQAARGRVRERPQEG